MPWEALPKRQRLPFLIVNYGDKLKLFPVTPVVEVVATE